MKYSIHLIAAIILISSTVSFPEDKINPVLFAEIHIPTLVNSSQNLSNFIENISPGSSGIIGVAIASLSFDKKMINFDLTSPIQIIGYKYKTDNNEPKIEWSIILSKKPKYHPTSEITDKGKTIYIKEFEDKVALSYTKSLLESISQIPSYPCDKIPSYDIKVIIYPGSCLTSDSAELFSINKSLSSLLTDKDVIKQKNLNDFKTVQIKMKYLNKVLNRFSKIESDVMFLPEKASVSLKFSFTPGSYVEKFSNAQEPMECSLSNAFSNNKMSLTGKINMTNEFVDAVLEMINEIYIETTDSCSPDLLSFHNVLLRNYSGNVSFSSSYDKNLLYSLIINCDKNRVSEIKSFLSKNKTFAENGDGVFKFSPENHPELSIFCKIEGNDIFIIYGTKMIPDISTLLLKNDPLGKLDIPEKTSISAIFNSNCKIANNSDINKLSDIYISFNDKEITIIINLYNRIFIDSLSSIFPGIEERNDSEIP